MVKFGQCCANGWRLFIEFPFCYSCCTTIQKRCLCIVYGCNYNNYYIIIMPPSPPLSQMIIVSKKGNEHRWDTVKNTRNSDCTIYSEKNHDCRRIVGSLAFASRITQGPSGQEHSLHFTSSSIGLVLWIRTVGLQIGCLFFWLLLLFNLLIQ